MNVNDYIQICVIDYSTHEVFIRNINKEWLDSMYSGDIALYLAKHLKVDMSHSAYISDIKYLDIQI